MKDMKEVIKEGNELIKFNSEKEKFIIDIVANFNGYNYAIKKFEEFFNKFAEYNKDNTNYKIDQLEGTINKYGNASKIKTNCFNYPHEFSIMTIEEFKEELKYFLHVAIDNSEELDIVKGIANSCGKELMPLYEERMPYSLKLAIFHKLEEEGIFEGNAKEEFLQLLEGQQCIANIYEFDEGYFEFEGVKTYLCHLEFDIVELKAFKYDALAIGTIDEVLIELAIECGYELKEVLGLGIIGICHLLEFCYGKKYFSSFKRSNFGMPMRKHGN